MREYLEERVTTLQSEFWTRCNLLNSKSVSDTNLVNFIVNGIFINKNTYIIPTNAYVTYRSVKDTDNVSRHVFSTESTHVNPRGHLLEVISPL